MGKQPERQPFGKFYSAASTKFKCITIGQRSPYQGERETGFVPKGTECLPIILKLLFVKGTSIVATDGLWKYTYLGAIAEGLRTETLSFWPMNMPN